MSSSNNFGVPTKYDNLKSTLVFDTYAGYGSVNTKIPAFTNMQGSSPRGVQVISNDLSNGLQIKATEPVKVAVTFIFESPASSGLMMGISVDSTDLTTAINAIGGGTVKRKAYFLAPAITSNTWAQTVHWTGYLYPDQILRPHTDGSAPETAARCKFEVTVLS